MCGRYSLTAKAETLAQRFNIHCHKFTKVFSDYN